MFSASTAVPTFAVISRTSSNGHETQVTSLHSHSHSEHVRTTTITHHHHCGHAMSTTEIESRSSVPRQPQQQQPQQLCSYPSSGTSHIHHQTEQGRERAGSSRSRRKSCTRISRSSQKTIHTHTSTHPMSLSVTPTSASSHSSHSSRSPCDTRHSCPTTYTHDHRHQRSNTSTTKLLVHAASPYERTPTYQQQQQHHHTRDHSMSSSSQSAKEMDCIDCNSSIISRSLLQLTQFVDASAIRWPNITLSSHQLIVVLANRRLCIIDCVRKRLLLSVHCDAHSAMMNPQAQNSSDRELSTDSGAPDARNVHLLAVRDNNRIKVVNLQNVQHALASRTHDDFPAILNDADMVVEHAVQHDPILFWRWLDAEIIAIITARHVYHWMPTVAHSTAKRILTLRSRHHVDDDDDDADNEEEEEDEDGDDTGSFVQYINYAQSKDGHYLLVQGLTQGVSCGAEESSRENQSPNRSHKTMNSVDGVLTLYDIDNGVIRHKLNAFGACFASLPSFEDITLFCYTEKEYVGDDGESVPVTKLYIVELSKKEDGASEDGVSGLDDDDEKRGHDTRHGGGGGHNYHVRVEREVQFYHTNDFVVSMVQCRTVLYAVTKLGCLLIFDISCGQCLYNEKVSRDVIFLVAPYPRENGIVALDRTGKLTLYYLNKSAFNDIPVALRHQAVSIVNYNAYNNSFALKHQDTCYESSLFLQAPQPTAHDDDDDAKFVLCVGHIKLVLSKALGVQHIGFISIGAFSGDEGTEITPLENHSRLSEDLRLLKIEVHAQCVDASFDAVLRYYHGHYGVSVGVIEDILSENLFNYNCDELKLFTMNFQLQLNQKLNDNVERLEKQVTLMHGERLSTLSNDELLEMEKTVNASYLKIRQFIRGKMNCIVCYEKEKHVLFKPCHHYVVCMRCSEKLKKCPVCNTCITERIKVFQ